MSSESSEGSDIELPSALPKNTNVKIPKSPSEDLLLKKQKKKQTPTQNQDPKKLTTKLMIQQALIDLKNRKGVSLHAIKKYMTERYNIDTEKNNYIIKKSMKKAVEDGTIIQTKGSGASGSFKLVPVKEKKKTVKPKKTKEEKEGQDTVKSSKPKKIKESSKENLENAVKTKTKQKSLEKKTKSKKTTTKEKAPQDKKTEKNNEKTKKVKVAKGVTSPAKKKTVMIKRKSIGSIIKPPKMKPSAKA